MPPQFHGGGGSLQYAPPGTTGTPAEILITLEPRGLAPTTPTGPAVLRGT